MLHRFRANPLIRAALLAAALAFCGLGLSAYWPQVRAAFGHLHWYMALGAFAEALAGAGCMMLAWRAVLADLGSRLPVLAAIRIMFVGQIGKYLPGGVWAFAALVELSRDHEVPPRRGASSVVISLAVALQTGLLVGVVALPLASASAARHYWWLLSLTPLVAVGLIPPVLGRLLDLALKLARQRPLERRPSGQGLLVAIGWSMLAWMFWGLHAWLLISDITGRAGHVLLLGIGSYALAWCAGILLLFFPSGIGPRELAFVAALAPVMPRAAALVVALMSRVVMTASDVAWAAAGVAIGRLLGASRLPAADAQRREPGRHRRPVPSRSETQQAPAIATATRTPAGTD